MSEALRRALIDTAVAMNERGFNLGTSGNLSVRTPDGMLITPSGVPYTSLAPEDIVAMDREGQAQGAGHPSSEWRFHLDLYVSREDAGAVVHAHPPHATSLACLPREIPAFHYEVALAGGHNIRRAPYATFGTRELSDNVLEALRNRRACLIANHGLVALGSDLPGALALAQRVELLAQMYRQCLQVGEPELLSREEMARVAEKFAAYGRDAKDRKR